MRLDEDVLREVVPRFLKDGWQVVSLFLNLVCLPHDIFIRITRMFML